MMYTERKLPMDIGREVARIVAMRHRPAEGDTGNLSAHVCIWNYGIR